MTKTADSLGELLTAKSLRIVLAESCTAGYVAATLGAIPGISNCFCGSVVAYRIQSKIAWLEIDANTIQDSSAESAPVAVRMAEQVLSQTDEADFSASVTGHLGPGAPAAQDGIIYVGVARRVANGVEICGVEEYQLSATGRRERRDQATECVLNQLERTIRSAVSG